MDLIDTVGSLTGELLGCGYAGQEPQDKHTIPPEGLVIVERIGGSMRPHAVEDSPWLQLTVLADSKKGAWDRIREVRRYWARPRSQVGGFFTKGIREVLAPEDATLTADPFYRVRVTFRFPVKGLA